MPTSTISILTSSARSSASTNDSRLRPMKTAPEILLNAFLSALPVRCPESEHRFLFVNCINGRADLDSSVAPHGWPRSPESTFKTCIRRTNSGRSCWRTSKTFCWNNAGAAVPRSAAGRASSFHRTSRLAKRAISSSRWMQARENSPGQVLRFRRIVSIAPYIGVKRRPIRAAQLLHRLVGLLRVASPSRKHDTPVRRDKPRRCGRCWCGDRQRLGGI